MVYFHKDEIERDSSYPGITLIHPQIIHMNSKNHPRSLSHGFLVIMAGFLLYAGFSCQNTGSNPIEISAEDFLKKNDPSTTVVLDARTRQEYEIGHLQGARLLDLSSPDLNRELQELDKNRTYYVYCHSGLRSRSVVNRMRDLGFTESYNIRGGILHLTRAGVSLIK
jgi:rhodanese-related sulfurtransferase